MPWDYDIEQHGYNFRLDEIRSAMGLSQIKKLREWNKKRNNAANYYTNNLKLIKGIETPLSVSVSEKHSWHLYVIKIKNSFGLTRNNLFKKLLEQGIRTSVHYKPLHNFSLYKKKAKSFSPLKNSSEVYTEILSLPLYPDISKKEQDFVISKIKHLQK